MPLYGSYPFSVEPFSEDFTGRLSWGVLGNWLLRCASLHAGQCGFGFEQMKQTNHVWVLSRLVVDLKQMPATGNAFQIDTWVSKVYRQFTDRMFSVSTTDGRPLGSAFSTWALIDLDSRQPLELSKVSEGGISHFLYERNLDIKGASRVRVKADVPVHSLKTGYSDLDINGHVNSIRYLQMSLDLFSDYICREGHAVYRVELSYAAETYCGETLLFFTDGIQEDRAQIDIRKSNGGTVAKVALLFQTVNS